MWMISVCTCLWIALTRAALGGQDELTAGQIQPSTTPDPVDCGSYAICFPPMEYCDTITGSCGSCYELCYYGRNDVCKNICPGYKLTTTTRQTVTSSGNLAHHTDSSRSYTVSNNVLFAILGIILLILVVHSILITKVYINHRRHQAAPVEQGHELGAKYTNAAARENREMPPDSGDDADIEEALNYDEAQRVDNYHYSVSNTPSTCSSSNENPSFCCGTGQTTLNQKRPVTGTERDRKAAANGAHKRILNDEAVSVSDMESYNVPLIKSAAGVHGAASSSRERHSSETEPLKCIV